MIILLEQKRKQTNARLAWLAKYKTDGYSVVKSILVCQWLVFKHDETTQKTATQTASYNVVGCNNLQRGLFYATFKINPMTALKTTKFDSATI